MRDERLVGPITAYILNNPLRAGLAASLGDYPHMGSSRYSLSDLVDMVQWMPPHLRR